MTPIESIYEIKSAVLDLQRYLLFKVAVVSKKAQIKYEQFVDRFFRENKSFPTFQQRYSCLHDFDYFLSLMESAVEEKNAENLLIIKSKELAQRYINNWNKHKEHFEEYKRRQ